MYGHLTCPEIFWHVSDKRIDLISNPEMQINGHTSLGRGDGISASGMTLKIESSLACCLKLPANASAMLSFVNEHTADPLNILCRLRKRNRS